MKTRFLGFGFLLVAVFFGVWVLSAGCEAGEERPMLQITDWAAAVILAEAKEKQEPVLFDPFFMGGMVLVGVLFYFMMIRPQRQKQQRHDQMISDLKKNDTVVTIGGIVGTVSNISKGGDKITLRVDDTTNAKITVLRSSIGSVDRPGSDKDS